MDPTDCRLHLPGAELHHTPRYDQEMDHFHDQDPEAAELHEALLREATRSGLPVEENAALHRTHGQASSHRAPVGRRAFNRLRPGTKPVPWLGELTTYGSDAVDDRGPFWRAYFSDLRPIGDRNREINDVLMASVRAKGGEEGVKSGEQDVHMTEAGDAVRKWCKSSKTFTFRIQI